MPWHGLCGFHQVYKKVDDPTKVPAPSGLCFKEMKVRDPFRVVADTRIQSKLMDSKLYIDFAIVTSMNLFFSSKDEWGGWWWNHHPHAILRSRQPGAASCDSTGLTGKSTGHWLADMIQLPPNYFWYLWNSDSGQAWDALLDSRHLSKHCKILWGLLPRWELCGRRFGNSRLDLLCPGTTV